MFYQQIIQTAHKASFADLDQLSRALWLGHGQGVISDNEAAATSAAIEARKATLKAFAAPSIKMAQIKPCRSPDRQRSIERRRRQALSGAIPASIAHCFTIGELAALSVVARAVQQVGRCIYPIDKIAALAGVSRSTVQNALRAAKRIGLIDVLERRRAGRRNDTNIIKIASKAWQTWLKLGGVGSEKKAPRLQHYNQKAYLNLDVERREHKRTLACISDQLQSDSDAWKQEKNTHANERIRTRNTSP